MATIATAAAQLPITLDMSTVQRVVLRPGPEFTDDDFFDFCQQHELFRIERNAEGDLIIMPPVGMEGTYVQTEVARELSNWAKRERRGMVFGSTLGIKFPDGSTFSPDASWITTDQWKAIPHKLRKRFAPVVPVFVIESAPRPTAKRSSAIK